MNPSDVAWLIGVSGAVVITMLVCVAVLLYNANWPWKRP
jgi:hypothetical protein